MEASTTIERQAQQSWISADAQAETFRSNFNASPFVFRHTLPGASLLTPTALAQTAIELLQQGHSVAGSDLAISAHDAATFDPASEFGRSKQGDAAVDIVRRIENGETWLRMTSLNIHRPEYKQILSQILDEISVLTQCDLSREVTWAALTVFVSSPNVTTPYHIDHEANFLFQVHGSKQVCLFDPNDREVLSELDIERFYAGDPGAASYHPSSQSRGTIFQLTPGLALHHPPLAPHWVKNGSEVSVSVSIGFCMRDLDRRSRVYQVNGLLRRLGLSPVAPGVSHTRDAIKAASLGLLAKKGSSQRDEILFSGIRRLKAPFRSATRSV